MSQTSESYFREKTARSLDTILVHNPTSEDVVIWNDKYGPRSEKAIIPKAQKDLGFGKGNARLPRFLAKRFCRNMIIKIITKISDEDWEKKKQSYRTLDETILHADKVTIRTNDAKLWKELSPKIWLGLVEKFGGEALPDPIEPVIPDTGDPLSDAMAELGLEDKVYEPTTETV